MLRHTVLLLAAASGAAALVDAARLDAVLLAPGFPYASFGFLLGDATGALYMRAVGGFNLSRGVPVASASKWVTQWVLSLLLEDGTLSMNMTARSVLAAPWGALPASDPRGDITLESLMSFTSGLNDSVAACGPGSTPAACAADLLAGQAPLPLPATRDCPRSFHYGGSHQVLAGAMAVTAARAGMPPAGGWNALFAARLARPWRLSTATTFYTPLSNPNPAGGLVISALDYATLLRAYFAGELLSRASVAAVEADRTRAPGTCIVYAPLAGYYAWHYGFGHWLECRAPGAVGGAARAWQPACDAGCAHSSIGLFGSYPYVDRCHGYWALLVVENGTAAASALLGDTLWPAAAAALNASLTPTATASPTPVSASGTAAATAATTVATATTVVATVARTVATTTVAQAASPSSPASSAGMATPSAAPPSTAVSPSSSSVAPPPSRAAAGGTSPLASSSDAPAASASAAGVGAGAGGGGSVAATSGSSGGSDGGAASSSVAASAAVVGAAAAGAGVGLVLLVAAAVVAVARRGGAPCSGGGARARGGVLASAARGGGGADAQKMGSMAGHAYTVSPLRAGS